MPRSERGYGDPMRPVDVPELPYAGRLFIWRCPTVFDGVLDAADHQKLQEAAISQVVCLLEDDELQRYGESLAMRRAATEAAGMGFHSVPIEDFAAPTPAQTMRLTEWLVERLEAGQTVLVHCMAGLGRAGTIAGCLLVHTGMKPADAISLVRWIRPGAIQSAAQESRIRSVAEAT